MTAKESVNYKLFSGNCNFGIEEMKKYQQDP